ncbi:hypothetical protein M441DRAFT_54915 [Trichoderma asperellum CBS 433.97]|uniref:Secreted protein n=1 Tax=Trichoderma asperellum (strain ATCC 204424 / CBS 433.97 / NBRC 101777) TaxID=1042311 RepID=A0A2T3ZM70_TRIA4|nr:hypothetical protein M441DRAFT_54915 [Trichoderma asperellum CBS 433.97]PTB45901.1 hypothetical protein M441DRAFT_54915 [Trichoderma asperellum CBS 433.97]
MLHGKTWIAMAVILLQRLVWMPAVRHCHLSAMSIRPAYYSCCSSSSVVKSKKTPGLSPMPPTYVTSSRYLLLFPIAVPLLARFPIALPPLFHDAAFGGACRRHLIQPQSSGFPHF